MSKEKIGRVNSELTPPLGQNTLEPKKDLFGSVIIALTSPLGHNT